MDINTAALMVGCLIPCLAVICTDTRYFIIPNYLSLSVTATGLLYAFYVQRFPEAAAGCVLAFGLFLAFVLQGGMGGGDAKLAAGLGAWFGYPAVFWVIALGAGLGVVWGVAKLLRRGELGAWATNILTGLKLRFVCQMRGAAEFGKLPDDPNAPVPPQAVPFGTCLAAAAWLIFLVRGV